MPMNMEMSGERSPRDIADGYLLLTLSKGNNEKEASTSSSSAVKKEMDTGSDNPKMRSLPNNVSPTLDALKERQYQDKLREHQLIEYLRSHNEERLRLLYPRGQTLATTPSGTGNLFGTTAGAADLHNHYLNLAAAGSGNALSYRVGSDELNQQQGLLHEQVRAALDEAAANQLRLLRPLTSPEPKGGARVCTPPAPSSPVASHGFEDSSSSMGPHLVPCSEKIPLPKWFKESKTTVVIGKGHLPRKTPGNQLLRDMIRDRIQSYRETNRRGRAIIVSDIYSAFQKLNPDGRCFGNFTDDGDWCEAKEHSARDKIAATFRDCLSHLYKSSTKSKVAKRRKRKAERAHQDDD